MPRKSWKPKNPYCRKSKLSKVIFEDLVYIYFEELTVGFSRSMSVGMLAPILDGENITRQTISVYFDKIGQYIWDNIILQVDPKYKKKGNLDEFLRLLYGEIDKVSTRYNIVYKFFKPTPMKIKDSNVPLIRTLMFHLLEKRSKILKGFPRGKFYLEFSRVFFVCFILEYQGIKLSNIDNFFEGDIRDKTNLMAWAMLMEFFEELPL